MTAEDIREYALAKDFATEGFPFDENNLVFKVGGKMFLIIPLDVVPTTFSVKTDPAWSEELREEYWQITGGFHLNKKHWNSVVCDGVRRELIHKLIDHSYDLVFQSLTKKARGILLSGS